MFFGPLKPRKTFSGYFATAEIAIQLRWSHIHFKNDRHCKVRCYYKMIQCVRRNFRNLSQQEPRSPAALAAREPPTGTATGLFEAGTSSRSPSLAFLFFPKRVGFLSASFTFLWKSSLDSLVCR